MLYLQQVIANDDHDVLFRHAVEIGVIDCDLYVGGGHEVNLEHGPRAIRTVSDTLSGHTNRGRIRRVGYPIEWIVSKTEHRTPSMMYTQVER